MTWSKQRKLATMAVRSSASFARLLHCPISLSLSLSEESEFRMMVQGLYSKDSLTSVGPGPILHNKP